MLKSSGAEVLRESKENAIRRQITKELEDQEIDELEAQIQREAQKEMQEFVKTNPEIVEAEVGQTRPNWTEYFKEIVQVTRKRSPCERLQVGCLFVIENRIVSQGYNGFLSGCPHTSMVRDGHEQATVHAEQNAICDCALRGVSCKGSTAYITHYPCIICTRLMLASGISEICYIEDYKNDELVKYLCDQKQVAIRQI